MTFAIDFDGTLCENKYPEIGSPRMDMINKCIQLRSNGHIIILNTCRTDIDLEKAIEWCNAYGLQFDLVNENEPERIAKYSDCRKIAADYYIDDRNLSFETFLRI